MSASLVSQCRRFLCHVNTRLTQIVGSLANRGDGHFQDLAYDTITPEPLDAQSASADASSILDAIMREGIVWKAVPKKRRSYDKKWMRRFGPDKVKKFMTPRSNLVACLQCGNWHERHTICGNCYSKVREETEAMRASMDHEDRKFNAPQTEVVYIYEDEKDTRPMHEGKYIVEMERPKPEWWPKNMLTKGHGSHS